MNWDWALHEQKGVMESGQAVGGRLGLEDPTLCLIITSSVRMLAAAQKGNTYVSSAVNLP